jgi:hypothetical protein
MWDVLNNATLGALAGAAAAFLLVAATDWRRNRRIATTLLPALLRRLQVLVVSRVDGANSALATVENDPPMRNIGLRFPVERIERYADQVPDRLTERQAFALDNLAFWMRESDRLNAASLDLLDQIDEAHIKYTHGIVGARDKVSSFKEILRKRYAEERVLLARVLLVLDAYLAGKLNERGGPLDTETKSQNGE